ncbi:MAG TPA: efflux RND transporter periplasmic adaptor subunit [Ignavibacteria bacterium]|nr:hypothetical protein [Bacteroidota bacterium]HRE12172.1 efflux RND transporter periplasmic adaptor subunit [Ignavibacteria bacterium]HRF65284.1 efflux RND transporter periplasmic adaptor subunit [Ignavibacteria bacterium]HRJ05186.1 efflux RND transporter periplasmic adaptor subunit [Ignavibacteria bacterium]HRJ84934.1 efflux RND transporter periplasmic adaptor subunit [Ignavibacteria bacterium]
MKEIKFIPKIIFALFFAAMSFFLYSCGNDGEGETTQKPDEKKLPVVKVMTVEPVTFTDDFRVLGVIKPFTSAKVSSEEGGLIVSLNKDKGSYVGKGEIIARLKKDVEIASLEQAEAQIELARMNYEKQKQLYEDNATTEIQYLTAKWQYEAAVRGADILKTRLKTGFIRSPISGVVDEKYMNRGEMSAPGSPIVNIIDISRVKVSAGVPEMYLTKIKMGQSVNVTVDVLPGVEFEGKISYVAPSLQGSSRTFEVEVVISNSQKLLKPGMNANVLILESTQPNSVAIQQDLIVDYGEEQYVYIANGDIAQKRVLKLGGRNGNLVHILEGLNPGDQLITEGFQALKDGQKIQVVK